MSFEADIAALGARFASRLEARAILLEADAARVAAGQPASALDGLRITLHSLAGSAPTLGFPMLGASARAAEDAVLACQRTAATLSAELLDEVRAMVAPVVAGCREARR